jgi:branched-chain amino acid aminotransferase
MKESCGKWFILNGELKPAEEFDNSLVNKGDSIYEVIRMVGGVPIFFSDHMSRLEGSVRLREKEMLADASALKNDIIRLASSDKRKEINIKLVFNYDIEGTNNYLIYYIDSVYPSPVQYSKGVKGILYFAERKDPEAKVINYRLKSSIHQELVNEGAYEALLVNEQNLITEGSKSNIFFLKGEKLITAPDNIILKGITRKYILQICNEQSIDVVYDCVNADEIGDYDAVFMTGTSPMVLPFNCVSDIFFSANNSIMKKLRELYMQKVEESIRSFKESA